MTELISTSNELIYPVLTLRDLVMFPKMVVPLFIGRQQSINALDAAIKNDGKLVLVTQRSSSKNNPKAADLYKVGVVTKVLQVLKLQNSNVKVLVEGLKKVKITKYITNGDFIECKFQDMKTLIAANAEKEIDVLQRTVIEEFEEYVKTHRKISTEIMSGVIALKDREAVCDAISAHIILPVEKKQPLLEITSIQKRLEQLLILIRSEVEYIKAESRIKNRVRNQIEENQKTYYLNEQLKAIHKELGEEDVKEELNEIANKIKTLKLSKEAKQKAESELKKLKTMSSVSSEATIVRNYLDWILEVPWKKYSKLKNDIAAAKKILDADHNGLDKVKERILEYLAVTTRTDDESGSIICLVGPPGVGKTSLAKSVASAVGRKFVKISLGGLRDEAEIRGHRRTYIGALPGKIIQAMKKAGTSNPLILLDEIDKLGHDFRGDPASALLDILDYEQNKHFNDHYLELDYDLSKVMFIATANGFSMPRPLLDRMEVIKLSGYTEEERLKIAINHLIPKQMKKHGLQKDEINLPEDVVMEVINSYTKEAGVRNLEREIAKLMRKVVYQIATNKVDSVTITTDNLAKFLGPKKFLLNYVENEARIGISNGLAYTEVGGELLAIEVVIVPGKGEIKATGTLGDVMKESVFAAISYIRSKANILGIPHSAFKDNDIHLHVPEGATPKDGPSAGIAIATALLSAVIDVPVRHDVAMTGEITLRGRVLEIGGLKEKLLAAVKNGIKIAIIPRENLKDLSDIPESVTTNLEIISAENVQEVWKIAMTEDVWNRHNKIETDQKIANQEQSKSPTTTDIKTNFIPTLPKSSTGLDAHL